MKLFRLHSHHLRKRSLLLSAALLLFISILTSWFFNSKLSLSYQQKQLQKYITAELQDARQLLKDSVLMRKLVINAETPEEFKQLANKNYGLFLFAETFNGKEDPLFWNSQKIIPPKPDFSSGEETVFLQLLNGFYVVDKRKLTFSGMTNNVVAYVLIPVFYKYYLQTENSPSRFAHDPSAINRIAIAEGQITDFPVQSLDKRSLFYVQQAPETEKNKIDPITVVLRLTALIFLLIALHLYAQNVIKRRGGLRGVAFLAGALLLIRLFLYFAPNVFSLRQFPIFDPTIYGNDLINRSLGDLLINSVLFCWVVLFAWNNLGAIKRIPSFLKENKIRVAGVVGIFLLMFATFQFADLVYSLVSNSKISFEVTYFKKLSLNTWFSFIILALLSLSYYYFSRLLFRTVLLLIPNLVHVYFTIAVVGLIFLSVQGSSSYKAVLFQLPVLVWLVLYSLILTQEQSILNRFRITIAGILFWIFVFSMSLAALIMRGNRERDEIAQRKIAGTFEEIVEQTKVQAISVALTSIDSSYLKSNFQRFFKEPGNSVIRDSIISSAFLGYANAYNTSIYVFNKDNKGVNNPDAKSYEELNNIYTTRGQSTTKKNLISYELSPTQVIYLIKREAYDSTGLLGSLFLVSTPKQLGSVESFYPNIFRRSQDSRIDDSYVIGIYKNNQLIQYNGAYNFPVRLKENQIPQGEYTRYNKDDFNELWFKASNQKIIIVAKKKESLIESITLFSYLFCAFLFMVGIIRLFELLSQIMRTWPRIEIFSRLSIRSQIQTTIIFISILSFLVIGVATITYIIQRYKRENIENLSRTSVGTLNELQKKAAEDSLVFSAGTFQDSTSMEGLKKLVSDISTAHSVIVNIYDTAGTLQITSDDQIYRKGVLSTKMDPIAYNYLVALNQVQRVQEEKIGDITYESMYTAVRNPKSGETFAYLNIPASSTQENLNKEISNFLVTVINLNAFIVLISGLIALFITNRITRSFSLISEKMKEVTLGKANEEIEWNKADEIGELVKQYNKMVQQLEESAAALAKSEREGAWREMARQVAHEIKNPLTPMKLSIQYLQKAIQNNHPNVKDLTSSVANTLIEQIDHLSKIAADFSQFANIGNKRLEVVDLHHVIGSLLDLYSANPKVCITWKPVSGEAAMQVDKTHMNRLFTNLLSNAVDACSEREKCIVEISEKVVADHLLVSITDNGDGIPKEMQSKIFTPNFTTKTSGTGLGLAMCKGIVEQAGGDIWFETKEGQGTTFFVQLPLVEQ